MNIAWVLLIALVGVSVAYDASAIDRLIKDRLNGREPKYYQANLEPEEIVYILKRHNEDRSNVDPPAADMKKIHYDMHMESLAVEWAERCNFEHPDTKVFPQYRGYGQNIGFSSRMKRDWKPIIDLWDKEIAYYHYDNHTCNPGKACGHYTQMVNALTVGVGCAVKLCDGHHDWTSHTLLWVCQYNPTGNYRGKRPYVKGPWCSKCPAGFQCEGGRLCSNGSNVEVPVRTTTTTTTTTTATTTTTTTTTTAASNSHAHKLTEEERRGIIDLHNKRRGEVDATNMRKLKYDFNLENMAVEWLNDCNAGKAEGPKYDNVGQNFAQSSDVDLDVVDLASTWFLTGQFYNNTAVTCRINDCSSYKQAMLSYETSLGCAWNRCDYKKPYLFPPVYFLSCFYNTNQYEELRAWLPGPKCSNCPKGYNCNAEMLCSDSD